MKFLTIRQPWASLIAVGAKTIETRPFSTKYRGPLAIHAGKAQPSRDLVRMGQWLTRWDYGEGRYVLSDGLGKWGALPLGAVVAVCDLIDVVPIVQFLSQGPGHVPDPLWAPPGELGFPMVRTNHNESFATIHRSGGDLTDVTDQLPFGDFTPGRFAWLLDNVRAVVPVEMKGALGLRDLPEAVADQLRFVT